MELLNGRVAVITGGAQGIGFAIGKSFVQHGAKVVIGDLDLTKAEDAAARLGGSNFASAVQCNVVLTEDIRNLVFTAKEIFGSLDIMVNNAGITRDATILKMKEEDFDLVISTHLKGTWAGTKYASEVMKGNATGSIINMSSISGKVGFVGQTNYSAAKAGIVGMSKAAAKEVARYGIRVNVIQPGLIRTAMTEALSKEIWEAKVSEVPLNRAGEVNEIASTALFLASDMSSYITGAVLEVTGGRYM